jgi:hypothetical protein
MDQVLLRLFRANEGLALVAFRRKGCLQEGAGVGLVVNHDYSHKPVLSSQLSVLSDVYRLLTTDS